MKKSKIKSIYKKEYEQIITKLTESRKKAKLTQSVVAEKFGRHQSYMAKIEGGERRLDVMEFIELARLYKKSPNYFLKDLTPDDEASTKNTQTISKKKKGKK